MELRYFILRRSLLLIPTIIGMTVLAFALLRAFPDYTLLKDFINQNASGFGGVPVQALLARAKIELGFNYPVPVQYFYFLINLFTGNWGYADYPISTYVYSAISLLWPNTVQLLIFTFISSVLIGIPLGTHIGGRAGSRSDHAGRLFSLVGYAMPQFFFGLLLLVIFGKGIIKWPGSVFPLFGMITIPIPPPSWLFNQQIGYILSSPTHMIFFDALIHRDPQIAFSALMHLALPVATLTYAVLAVIVRTMRAGMIDASVQEYIRSARAKGVPLKIIIKKHMRKNALIPTVTSIGLLMGYVMTGLIVVETIFGYQGLGWYLVQSTLHREVWGIIYSAILFGFFIIIANLVVDVVYAYLNPRIAY